MRLRARTAATVAALAVALPLGLVAPVGLAAPAFALLPIAGCGAAATLRRAAHTAAAPTVTQPPLVPITAVVTTLPSGR